MPGRESDYDRGFIRGVSAIVTLVSSGKVKTLDTKNILQYAQHVMAIEMEKK